MKAKPYSFTICMFRSRSPIELPLGLLDLMLIAVQAAIETILLPIYPLVWKFHKYMDVLDS